MTEDGWCNAERILDRGVFVLAAQLAWAVLLRRDWMYPWRLIAEMECL